jgi:penicillin-binding protein 2
MRLSCVLAMSVVLAGLGGGARQAAALDAPHTLHHSKSPRLIQQQHRASRHSGAREAARATAKTATAGAQVTFARGKHGTSRNVSNKVGSGAATIRRTRLHGRHRFFERFTASSFASSDIFASDVVTGEDPMVRQAAVEALGGMNGTAVVINPANGRILAMVNQKLALSPGAEPCSTIKITVAMAALSEGLVTRDTMVQLPGFRMNMTQALAKSNNLYFEELGRELGFERVRHYANQFGLGELAGYHIEGEQLGIYPDHVLSQAEGGVGRMCSFGQGVSLTPLQLGAYVAALANGGTLYYLQHPTTPAAIAAFAPKVKRALNIAKFVPDLQDGMAGAVEYGTARRLRTSFTEFPVFGKTGTCSDKGTRFGWFASYAESPMGGMVTVFFLQGGRPTFGPRAAELTGAFYRNLWDHNYFVDKEKTQQSAGVFAPGAPSDLVRTAGMPAVNQ